MVVESRFGVDYLLFPRDLLPYVKLRNCLLKRAKSVVFWSWLQSIALKGLFYFGSTVMTPLTEGLFYLYSPIYQFADRFDFVKDSIELPTPKRVLYRNWFEDEYHWGRINGAFFKWESKLKVETAKVGKVGRLYASGQSACLLDRVSPDIAKKLYKERIVVSDFFTGDGGLLDFEVAYTFVEASDPEISRQMYESLLTPRKNGIEIICFSDDGIGASYVDGSVTLFEFDISSCDASNGPAVFGLVYQILKVLNEKQAGPFIRQCANPTVLVNPANDEEKVTLTPEFMFEYSGSLGTTFQNDTAVVLISMGVCEHVEEHGFQAEKLCEIMTRGAEINGWKITCFTSERLPDVTFLKRFYNGEYSILALGCVLRSIGVFPGGLSAVTLGVTPGVFRKLTDMEKLRLSVKIRMEGLVHEPHHLIFNALRTLGGLPPLPDVIPLDSLQERYGGHDYLWHSLVDKIETLRPGQNLYDPILHNIYKIDYGLE
jgi:hypothetical protein